MKLLILCVELIIVKSSSLKILNINSFADENKRHLKIGLLAPFSGEYRDIGQSIMLSLQLALKEIGDDNIIIFPRDSGFNNQAKLIQSINSLRDENVKIVIGPINFDDFEKQKQEEKTRENQEK